MGRTNTYPCPEPAAAEITEPELGHNPHSQATKHTQTLKKYPKKYHKQHIKVAGNSGPTKPHKQQKNNKKSTNNHDSVFGPTQQHQHINSAMWLRKTSNTRLTVTPPMTWWSQGEFHLRATSHPFFCNITVTPIDTYYYITTTSCRLHKQMLRTSHTTKSTEHQHKHTFIQKGKNG